MAKHAQKDKIKLKVKSINKLRHFGIIIDQRAVDLVKRLNQTIKGRLACSKTAARNHFNSKASIVSIIYLLRICRKRR